MTPGNPETTLETRVALALLAQGSQQAQAQYSPPPLSDGQQWMTEQVVVSIAGTNMAEVSWTVGLTAYWPFDDHTGGILPMILIPGIGQAATTLEFPGGIAVQDPLTVDLDAPNQTGNPIQISILLAGRLRVGPPSLPNTLA